MGGDDYVQAVHGDLGVLFVVAEMLETRDSYSRNFWHPICRVVPAGLFEFDRKFRGVDQHNARVYVAAVNCQAGQSKLLWIIHEIVRDERV